MKFTFSDIVAPQYRRYSIAAGVALVICIAFVWALFIRPLYKFQSGMDGRIELTESQTSNAFELHAGEVDMSQVDLNTTLVLKTRISVSEAMLKRALHMKPAFAVDGATTVQDIDADVTLVGTNEFHIQPKSALLPGTIYRIVLDAVVRTQDGDIKERDFSWAIQTKNIFRVISSTPGPNASAVPVDTAIEFVMSTDKLSDVAGFITISPQTKGRSEIRGRSIIFLPEKPLSHKTLYTVTLKKEYSQMNDVQKNIHVDTTIRFETAAKDSEMIAKLAPTFVSPIVSERPEKEIHLPIFASMRPQDELLDRDPEVTGYALTIDEAEKFLQEESKIPEFAYETRLKGDVFAQFAKKQVFQAKAKVQNSPQSGMRVIVPGQKAGRYIIKTIYNGYEQMPRWAYVEITNLATHIMSDKEKTLVWAVNADTGKPLEGIEISLESEKKKTDASGTAFVRTPTAVTSPTTTDMAAVIRFSGAGMESLVRLGSADRALFAMDFRSSELHTENTVAYVYADRPLYHPTDKAQIFGIVQDRDQKNAPQEITLDLQRSGFLDFFFPSQYKVYRSVTPSIDQKGIFRTEIDWSDVSPGYYTLSLKRSGKEVAVRYIEIRDFVKPAYSLDIVLDQKARFLGDAITGTVHATFFDGTPVSKLDISLRADLPQAQKTIEVKTDADGIARFVVPTDKILCDIASGKDEYCQFEYGVLMTAFPKGAEEGMIVGRSYANLYRTDVVLAAETISQKGTATATFTANHVDLALKETIDRVQGDALRATTVQGRVLEQWWEAIENGSYYDSISKKNVPRYSYEQRSRTVKEFTLRTDTVGKAVVTFDTPSSTASYQIIAWVIDSKNRQATVNGYIYANAYSPYGAGIELSASNIPVSGYAVDEKMSLGFKRDGKPLDASFNSSFLFVKTQRGIKDFSVGNAPNIDLVFTEQDIPNMNVRGVAFIDGNFVERQYSAVFDTKSREITIQMKMDKESYAPGSKAKVHIQGKTREGKPATGAQVALSVVDEALFATSGQGANDESPLAYVYNWVTDGVLQSMSSHSDETQLYGGAEKGGGGGNEAIRRNFKDTAAFSTIALDANGEGDVEVILPDNITSWRATAVAIHSNLFVGSAHSAIAVTKPLFVDVVLPQTILESDIPVLKVRAYGTGLSHEEVVSFTVHAPELSLNQVSVTGTAFVPTYIPISAVHKGTYTVIVSMKTEKGLDTIEKTLKVIPSRFLRYENVQLDAKKDSIVSGVGSSSEVEVVFAPMTRSRYVSRVQAMSLPWSARIESRIAAVEASRLLGEYFGQHIEVDTQGIKSYQQLDGGISPLPYSSSDVELTSKIALVQTSAFDRVAMARFLWEKVMDSNIHREEQIHAYAGLAALGEPVLTGLRKLSEISDLSWREKLAVIRGFESLGDRENARELMQEMIKTFGKEQDRAMYLAVARDLASNILATAELAHVAAVVSDPAAEQFDVWLERNWDEDAFPMLDRLAYLKAVVPIAIGDTVHLEYVTGLNQKGVVDLVDGNPVSRTFTSQEMKGLKITSVIGLVSMQYSQLVTKKTEPSQDVSLSRVYTSEKNIEDLREGDPIQVTITPRWDIAAPKGCYTVRDHMPAGLAPMIDASQQVVLLNGVFGWYPVSVEPGVISFIVCKPGKGEKNPQIVYSARVVARGIYLAESAIMQSMEAPSIGAMSSSVRIQIK